ncbi:hypothetical protein ABIE26_002981 [Pedobacter africanus]|uniref:hypothetical protein n=1 Tax=Pedobacter africanus TaxID=151894 RepID=UPI003392425C
MKNLKVWVPCLLIFLCACSCKKKTSDSPGYPPGGQYFVLQGQRLDIFKNDQLLIEKLDGQGNVTATKNITEHITISGSDSFRIAGSWKEVMNLFTSGINKFRFKYADIITDNIEIDAVLNTQKNTIEFKEVKLNGQAIQAEISNSPAANSKIYKIN